MATEPDLAHSQVAVCPTACGLTWTTASQQGFACTFQAVKMRRWTAIGGIRLDE